MKRLFRRWISQTAINTVECASICKQTGEELPWYKQAKAALRIP